MTVLFGFADAVGALLCEAPGAGPLAWLAVGSGLEEWDATAPPDDRGRRALTTEVVRVRLRAGREVVFRPLLGVVEIVADLPPGVQGPLREVGVFAGARAGVPGHGVLVHHAVHEREDVDPDATARRTVHLTLDPAWPAGARALIGRLLAGESDVVGLRWFVAGTSDADPPVSGIRLADEAVRRPLDRRHVVYDAARRTITVEARLEAGEGPPELREIGVAGGDPGDGRDPSTGTAAEFVAVRAVVAVDRTRPVGYHARFAIPLVARFDVAVPDLAGRPLDEAARVLRDGSLVLGGVERRAGADGDVGRIVEQRPAAGDQVNEGRPVDVVVGARASVAVPLVAGLSEDDARAVLIGAELTVAEDPVEVVTGVFRPVADGTTPPAGTAVEEGTVVVLRMAVPRRVRVPDLRGRTPAIATAVLGQVGLRLTDRDPEAVASSARPGTIVRQNPTAPREVTIGSTVAVTVAEPWSVEVPDLDGLSVDAVPARLQAAAAPVLEKLGRPGDAAGLTLGAVTPAASTRDIGTVVGQRPDAGESRFLYGTVDVSVAARPATVVPDVRRLHQLAATARLTEADLVMGGVRRRPSRTVAVGGVLEQRPLPADEVDPGTAVDVVVSSGQRAVVPNVLGRPVPVAIETITSAGFGVAPVRRDAGSSDSVPGTVVFQAPAPGSSVVAGTEVELTVAVGVPRVIGRTFADAVHELESLGYVVARVDEPVTEGSGTVLVQDPQAGTPADAGTVVTLVVGVSTRVFVPDLTGLDIVDATDRLTETGLVLAGTSTVPADGREGLVVEQTPIADEEVVRGTGVSVVLGAPVVVAVIVPAVVGLTQEAARQALAASNVVIEVRELRPSGEVAAGVVMEQDPIAGSARPPGSIVAVVVATEGVVTVPAVVGLGLAVAERLVVAARLHIDAGPIRPGTLVVTSQRPAAGAQAVIGSTVVVTVQGIVAAPALEGLLITVARATAQRTGLTLAESLEFGGIRPGLVLSQDPLAGEPVPVGGTIAVTVSRFGRPGSEFDPDIFERAEVVVTRPDRIGPVIRPGPIFERPGLLDRIVRPEE